MTDAVETNEEKVVRLERQVQAMMVLINPPRGDTSTMCEMHGPLTTTFCPACDAQAGVNRKMLQNEARIHALREELVALGIDPGPDPTVTNADPKPNEARPVLTKDEKIAELQREMEELAAS